MRGSCRNMTARFKNLLFDFGISEMKDVATAVRADNVPSLADGTQVPEAYRKVGVTEHLNSDLPLDARFYNEDSQYITLRELLHPDRPILLQLGYLDCPMLCDTISRSLIDAAKKVGLNIGSDF